MKYGRHRASETTDNRPIFHSRVRDGLQTAFFLIKVPPDHGFQSSLSIFRDYLNVDENSDQNDQDRPEHRKIIFGPRTMRRTQVCSGRHRCPKDTCLRFPHFRSAYRNAFFPSPRSGFWRKSCIFESRLAQYFGLQEMVLGFIRPAIFAAVFLFDQDSPGSKGAQLTSGTGFSWFFKGFEKSLLIPRVPVQLTDSASPTVAGAPSLRFCRPSYQKSQKQCPTFICFAPARSASCIYGAALRGYGTPLRFTA